MARRLFQHPLLRADITEALRYTERGWGERKKEEYKALIREAKDALRENPFVARPRPDIHPQARVYQIAQPGRDAAHVFLFAIAPDGMAWATALSRELRRSGRSPALLPSILLLAGAEGFLLRAVRLWRILRLARLGRFSRAIQAIGEAVRARRYEFLLSGGIAVLLLLTSSTLLYFVEGSIQPEAFGSIPRAMWWSIATLTTVGYGDVYPISALGRLFAALTALTGIGLIAMPTGILAAAFSEALRRQKQQSTRDADNE